MSEKMTAAEWLAEVPDGYAKVEGQWTVLFETDESKRRDDGMVQFHTPWVSKRRG